MATNKNDYMELLTRQAQKQLINLNIEQEQRLGDIFSKAGQSLLSKYKSMNQDLVSAQLLKAYLKSINTETEALMKEMIERGAEIPAGVQQKFLEDVAAKVSIDMSFGKMFNQVPKATIANILTGAIYEDGKGLSSRIWGYGLGIGGNIQAIVAEGIAQKMPAKQIADLLEPYVDPTKHKKWNKTVKSSSGAVKKLVSKRVEYNSFRLARTTLNHSFQLSNIQSCLRNPFVDGLEWVLSREHSVRMNGNTDICDERSGHIYAPASCPFDHPNGLCHTEPVVNKSFDEVADELLNWVAGEKNPKLDNWYDTFYPKSKEPDETAATNDNSYLKMISAWNNDAKKVGTLDTYKKKIAEAYPGLDVDNFINTLDTNFKSAVKSSGIYVKVPNDKILSSIMSDGRFKTQFETNTSKGQLNNTTRRDAEKKMFGYADDLDPKKRPIYAYLSPDGSQDGTTAYGSVIVKLKNDVKSRTTLFGSDTLMATNNAKEPTAKISTFDDFNVESVPLKLGADIGHTHVDTILKDSEDIRKMSTRPYIEAQVHEGVTVKDIDSIIFKKRPDKIVTDQLDAAGIKWEVKKTWK